MNARERSERGRITDRDEPRREYADRDGKRGL